MKQLISEKKISINWTDMDTKQQVNPTRYFDYMTETRHELLVKPYLPTQQERLFPVDVSCEFKQWLTYPGIVTVKQYSEQIGYSSFVLSYELLNSQGQYCAIGKATVVLVNKTDSTKSVAIPAYIKKLLGDDVPTKQPVKPLTIDTTTLLNSKIIALRWTDIDAFRHLDNARYVDFMMEAYSTLLVNQEHKEYLFLLNESRCTFGRELHYPGDVVVKQYLVAISDHRVTLGYQFLRKDATDIYALGLATFLCLDSQSNEPIQLTTELIIRAFGSSAVIDNKRLSNHAKQRTR